MAKSTKPAVPKVEKQNSKEEKRKALETAITHIEKTYGKGAVMKLGQASTMSVDSISTGSLGLDMALGIGGVPRGRVIEVYGPESSGKTTVALHIVAEAQRMGGEAAFIDVEHALDPVYAKALGVDIDSLLVSQPDTGEQALEIMEALIRSGALDVVVLDSVAAMVTKAEIEGDMGDSHVGVQARLMSQALRKLTSVISRSNCVAIFINQVREKIGQVYGNPETTPGGRALKFYSSVRIEVRRGEAIKSGTDVLGNKTKCKIVKNKVAPPFKEVMFDLMYGEGISRVGEIIDFAVDADIIDKSGAWFSYKGDKIGQGRDKVKKYLKENPEIREEIAGLVMAKSAEVIEASTLKNKAEESANAEKSADTNEQADSSTDTDTPTEKETKPKAKSVTPPTTKPIDIDIDADETDF